ncbi:SGNH hydrolase-type esterase domain-containing protein [Glomus cerebriforme]|uniref:SGNH hydrolase-type esterase domain-containing protein n=1 Tax=Glomus cerebriforme TaxID=658196 RepID=A0A397SPU6_9GLOM|nr:SGNH hydrolase-type esterase domain-containing protein [Glomus cerebriforme]
MASKQQEQSDSLTAGYSNYGTVYHSYGIRLEERFEKAGKDIEIIIEGLSGDRVIRMYENRLQRAIRKQVDKGKKFDYVVILGGTNDIFNKIDPHQIFDGLKKLYDICENHGAIVLALTIMEFFYEEYLRPVEQRRNKVNELMIRDYSTTNNKIILCDLAKELPANSISEDQRKLYWDDGVHLTVEGYDHMGDIIYESLINQMTK